MPRLVTATSTKAAANRQPRSRARLIVRLFVTVFALALIAVAVWGVWISADAARPRHQANGVSPEQDLNTAKFVLIWFFCFAPFLYFAVAILWSTFAPEERSWLTPLRLFSLIVSLRAAAEVHHRGSGVKSTNSGSKALPPGSSEKTLGQEE